MESVPFSGLCSAHLRRKSSRYRSRLRASNPISIIWASGAQVSRNTLAHANEHRDWRIYADFAQVLIAAARDLYGDEPFGVRLSETVYALSLFPWGKFRRRKLRETAYAAGSARQHPDQRLCDRRPSSRRQHSGPVDSRSRSVLLARSRLCGVISNLSKRAPQMKIEGLVGCFGKSAQEYDFKVLTVRICSA